MKTSIPWTDITVNPILAKLPDGKLGFHCRKVSPGCLNCYAETFNLRQLPARGTGLRYRRSSADQVEIVFHRPALDQVAKLRNPTRIFWCSMTDAFGSFVPPKMQLELLDAAAAAADAGHVSQILTKRAENAARVALIWRDTRDRLLPWGVHLGFSAEDQPRFDERWLHFKETYRYTVGPLWCSYEPALGPIDFAAALDDVAPFLGWIVVGGESGGGARGFELRWARYVLRQAAPARRAGRTALYMKQAGARWARTRRYLGRQVYTLGDAKGEDPAWWPADLRVREFPERKA